MAAHRNGSGSPPGGGRPVPGVHAATAGERFGRIERPEDRGFSGRLQPTGPLGSCGGGRGRRPGIGTRASADGGVPAFTRYPRRRRAGGDGTRAAPPVHRAGPREPCLRGRGAADRARADDFAPEHRRADDRDDRRADRARGAPTGQGARGRNRLRLPGGGAGGGVRRGGLDRARARPRRGRAGQPEVRCAWATCAWCSATAGSARRPPRRSMRSSSQRPVRRSPTNC